MPSSFGFFSDSGLTTPVTAANLVQDADGVLAPADQLLYFGSATAARTLQASSDPGVDHLQVEIVASASGSGQPATALKLAATLGGLDSAVAGDPLDLGVEVLSESANAKPVYVRWDDTTGVVGSDTAISLAVLGAREDAA